MKNELGNSTLRGLSEGGTALEVIASIRANKATLFLEESLKIEGIERAPAPEEIDAHCHFMALEKITIKDLQKFVSVLEPSAKLRSRPGMEVFIGGAMAPFAGTRIKKKLQEILDLANLHPRDSFEVHNLYEQLHPFTDCNGRSGRMLWLWMVRDAPLGFLHTWYYHSLRQWKINESVL